MAKLTLATLSNLNAQSSFLAGLNANFTAIAAQVDLLLSRDGESPNTLTAELDANSQNINNVNNAYVQKLFIGGVEASLGTIQPIAIGEMPAGSAASPGIAVDGDSNTGLFQPTADELGIAVGGVSVVEVDSTGMTIFGDLVVGDVDAAGINADTLDTTGNVAVGGSLTVTGSVTLPAFAIPSASTATTQSANDNSTKVATTAYVDAAALSAASQAEQEAATSTTKSVTPGRQQYHPSASKGWVIFDGATGTIKASYNVTSVTRSSEGRYYITWDTDFSSAEYVVTGSCGSASGDTLDARQSSFEIDYLAGATTAGKVYVCTKKNNSNYGTNGYADHSRVHVVAYGDQ